ncbi:MAG: hypothetical protein ACOYL3_10990 [Desulfuromonadaceae bacterium]
MGKVTLYAYFVLLLTALTGCGGGSASIAPMPQSVNKALELSTKLAAADATNTTQPIKGIQVTLELPVDVTPIPDPNGNIVTCLNTSALLQSGYNSTTNTIVFSLWPSVGVELGELGLGKIARITYETKSGSTLSVSSLQPAYKVTGPKAADGTIISLTSEIVPAVSLVTYQKP